MGQLFGHLTKTGVTDPAGGQTQWFNQNDPGAIQSWIQKQRGAFQPSTANIPSQLTPPGGTPAPAGPTTYSQPAPGPMPSFLRPNFSQAASMGAMPGGVNAMSPALSKGGKLAMLLTSGLQGALAGRAASENAVIQSRGRSSGGAGLGFESGYQLPFLRASQQLGVQKEQAETQMKQAELKPVDTSYGPMPVGVAARSLLPWMVRAGGQVQAADIRRDASQANTAAQIGSRENIAGQNIASREKIAGNKPQFTNPFEAMLYGTQEQQQAAQQFLNTQQRLRAQYRNPTEFEERYRLYQKDPQTYAAIYGGDKSAAQDQAAAVRTLNWINGRRRELQGDWSMEQNEKASRLQDLDNMEQQLSPRATTPAATPRQGGAGRPQPSAQHKVGDTVYWQGQPHTVKRVLPNGQLELQ